MPGCLASRAADGRNTRGRAAGRSELRVRPQVPSIVLKIRNVPGGHGMTQSHQSKISTSRRRLIKAALAGIVAPAVLRIGPAFAAYPERPVRIIVANTPGGPSDIIARIMAAAMQEATGNTFIVENKGGAGGNIGMGLAARSEPDGYSLLLSTSAYSVNPGLYEKLPYDPFKDFAAVGELAVSPHIFVVKADYPAKTMKEFVAL